jgi:protein TonB
MSARSSQHQIKTPRLSVFGWSLVIFIHSLVIYLLIIGSNQGVLRRVIKPLEALIIQDVNIQPLEKPLPTSLPKAPERPIQEAPKIVQPTFVPPAEVQSNAPAINTITSTTSIPSQAQPAVTSSPKGLSGKQEMGIVCPKQVRPEMPVRAIRDGIEGVVKVQILVQSGEIKDITILSGPKVFHSAVRDAILQYKCKSDTDTVTATQEFSFKLE